MRVSNIYKFKYLLDIRLVLRLVLYLQLVKPRPLEHGVGNPLEPFVIGIVPAVKRDQMLDPVGIFHVT